MVLPGAKERRCNLFDDHGRPRRLTSGIRGCSRDASACFFVHPHEREWKTAAPSRPPKRELVADSDSEFYYILLDKHGKSFPGSHREPSPHRKDSMATSPRSRRQTFDSAMDSSSRRGRSRSPSAASDQLEKLRRDRDRNRREDPLRHGNDSSRQSRSRSKDRGKERLDNSQNPSLSGSRATDGRAPVPPSQPPKPSAMLPPPPPPKFPEAPKLPAFASNTDSTAAPSPKGLKALSLDEQRKVWHERIDLMFTSVTARRDYTKLESDLAHIRVLSNSSLFQAMPEARRAHINEQKVVLEREMEKKRKEINDIIHKLISSEFWPMLKASQVTELEKGVGEVKKHVLEVKNVMDDLKSSCDALLKARGESVPMSDGTSDLDRPSKRRRLEGDAEGHGHTAKELETFRDKLALIDRHISDLENDFIQRDQIISDEIDQLITARLEEEDALYPPIKLPSEVPRSEIEAVVDAKNQELNRAVATAGDEIGMLATEVAELISKVNILEARCQALEAENQEIKSKFAQEAPKLEIHERVLARREKEIEAIAAALQAYISQAPASQSSGDPLSAEYVVEALDTQLNSLFRDKFSTTLATIQQEVFDKVQESHDRTLNTMSPKVMLLLKMVNLITARVGKPDMDTINE